MLHQATRTSILGNHRIVPIQSTRLSQSRYYGIIIEPKYLLEPPPVGNAVRIMIWAPFGYVTIGSDMLVSTSGPLAHHEMELHRL